MAELCPDCERERAETATEDQGRCKAHLDGLRAPSLCKDLTIARLRRELSNALSIANSRTYCRDSPEVLKARVEELESLAFPPTHNERGQEDDDEVCDVCSHSAEQGKHTYRDCVANIGAVESNVIGLLQEENRRMERELAEARAIGGLERRYLDAMYAVHELAERSHGMTITADVHDETEKMMQAWRALIEARAATGEKESDRG